MTLFPNPAQDGRFSIKTTEAEISFVKIYNLQGQEQKLITLENPAFTVDVNLPALKQPYVLQIGLVNGIKLLQKITTD